MGVKHQRALPQISTTETLKPNKHAYIMLVSLVREPGPNIKIMRVYNISQVFKLFLWRQLYNYQKYFVLVCLFKLQEWSDPCSSWSDLLPCWNRIHKKVVNSKNHKWIRKSIKKEFQIIFTSNPKKDILLPFHDVFTNKWRNDCQGYSPVCIVQDLLGLRILQK